MQIIDFEKKGNVVRFYLGEQTTDWGWTNPDYKQQTRDGLKTPDWLKPSDKYYGDDWDDAPYEHNAGTVYQEFIKGYHDIAFDFDSLVLEPSDSDYGYGNSRWTKDAMRDRMVPCIIVVPKYLNKKNWSTDFEFWVGCEGVQRYYFGDELNADA